MRDLRPRFPFTRPAPPRPELWLGTLEESYQTRWFANRGPVVKRLQYELAARDPAGDRAAVAVASGTAGLVAALLALDARGPVAVPSFTFPASAHAIRLAGGEPVLCDIDPATWELDPEAAARAVADHGCIAIMHVRSFGLVRDLSEIEAVARDAAVPLVVDSAAGFGGAGADGAPVGRAGRAEVFSFHATKTFSVGEGGAVIAEHDVAGEIASRANFSLEGGDVTGNALNAKMSEVTAAISVAMLQLLDDHISRRAALVARLLEAFANTGIEGAAPPDPGRPAWQTLPVLLADESMRSRVVTALAQEGVEARRYYAPGLHVTTAFAACDAGPLPVTEEFSARMLCLPLYSDLSESEEAAYLDAVTRGLRRAIAGEMTHA